MLNRLAINDVVLIDRLALELGDGLIVFTGETGAGKSILLDALGLALGARSDAALVRRGSANAAVTAEFSLPRGHAANLLLAEQGIPAEDALILRRTVSADGKSRASINDQPVSIGLLRIIGQHLVEIHGQFESHGLLDAATHRKILDAFGGHGALADTAAAAHAAWQAARQAESEAAEAIAAARREEDYLRAALRELDDLAPEAGEADGLAARRTQLQNREKIVGALDAAQKLLTEHRGAARLINEAAHGIAKIATQAGPEIQEILATLDRLASETDEAGDAIDRLMRDDMLDPAQLNIAEERLFALRAAARKHQTAPDELPQIRRNLAARLAALDHQTDHLAALAKATAASRRAFSEAVGRLSAARANAAKKLEKEVNNELPALKLGAATLTAGLVSLPEEEWNAHGGERVAFLGQTNPGAAPAPLQKIASGGELARFMLALKVVLAAADPVPTLVFDEVDAGIGGATAAAVGERLAKLAQSVQVMVVTHSPQVAAKAAQHWRVEKSSAEGMTTTAIARLDDHARREEIARMLAGSAITDAARAAAADLIAENTETLAVPANLAPKAKRAKRQ
ncbi:MAG: DNA repair protein RecN [Alphaproteobacteria bacterium]